MAVEWSRDAPISPIREIEARRKRTRELRAQKNQRREEREAAAARVTALERADRERMAQLMAAGKDASSDIQAIEKAQATAAASKRQAEALSLAIATSEAELGEVIRKHRGAWAKAAEREVVTSRTAAQDALAAFTAALSRHGDARVVAEWVATGIDRELVPKLGLIGHAPGSERVTANSSPINLDIVLGWLDAAVASQPEPQSALVGAEN